MTITTHEHYEAEKVRLTHLKTEARLDSQHIMDLIDVRKALEAYEKSLAPKTREEAYRQLVAIYHPWLQTFPDRPFVQLLMNRYGVPEVRIVTEEQLADLLTWMRAELRNHETLPAHPAPKYRCPRCERESGLEGVCAICIERDMTKLLREELNPTDEHARFVGI